VKLVFQLDSISPGGGRYKVSCRYEAEFEKEIEGRDGEITVIETKLHRVLRQWGVIDIMAGEDGTPIFENLIGLNGMVQVEHSVNKAGIVTAHFSRVLPAPEGTLIATPYKRVCERPDYEPPEFSAFGECPYYYDDDYEGEEVD
jgi:hypothetical protein